MIRLDCELSPFSERNTLNLIKMLILYYRSERYQGRRFETKLPPAFAKKMKKWNIHRHRQLSLFKPVNLRFREGQSHSYSSGSYSNGYKLHHRIKVRGHFRWQAYGSKMSLRKLIWISEHERGTGLLIDRCEAIQL